MNKSATNQQYVLQKEPWTIWANVLFKGTGAPVLQTWGSNIPNPAASGFIPAPTGTPALAGPGALPGSKGVLSVTRNGVGDYTFVFQGTFTFVLGMNAVYDTTGVGGISAAALDYNIINNSITTTASPSLRVLLSGPTDSPTDPLSGEIGLYTFFFANTGAT